ncbi:HNH endonuclease [Cytobacillus sp. Hz8]|uniref:HNH endonuclease n=1 Tax=Cytobacillus sp. Hz8 TaxID=3347168 RepID=UPI0035E318A1
MDVKYIPADWEKMKNGVGDLIGLHRFGKGMIDELKDISGNLKDAKSDIENYDSDGVIQFEYTSQKGKYQDLFEDFKILHGFTGKVGDIVDQTIDEPFYNDMDAFVEAIQNISITNYTTTNRIGAKEIRTMYAGYGAQQKLEVPKTKINLEDLFSGDNFYGERMKLEYEAVKKLHPDQDFSQKEYQLAVLNSRAFEYESIKDSQENKEFWGQIAALVVIVGVSLVCPPAGMALGAVYGSLELKSAITGKDWISGRELGTSERWVRGLLSPLDIVPGVSAVAKFSSATRTLNLGKNAALFGMKTGVKTTIQRGIVHVDDLVKEAGKLTASRLRNAGSAIKDGANVVKNKVIKDTIELADLADSTVTFAKKINPFTERAALTPEGVPIQLEPEKTHVFGDKVRRMLGEMDGVNVGTKGTVNVHRSEIDEVIKNDYDINGNLINRSIVPKGYESVENFLKVVDDTTIKEYGYDSIEEFKVVVGYVEDYLNASPKNNILNKSLAGGTHVKGVDYDVLGFPIFKGENLKYTLKLDERYYVMKDTSQFKECTRILKEAIEKGEVSRGLFTPEQLEQILKERAKIKGLTWHHHQVPGKMQLVVKDIHGSVNHLGGNKLWGEGIR